MVTNDPFLNGTGYHQDGIWIEKGGGIRWIRQMVTSGRIFKERELSGRNLKWADSHGLMRLTENCDNNSWLIMVQHRNWRLWNFVTMNASFVHRKHAHSRCRRDFQRGKFSISISHKIILTEKFSNCFARFWWGWTWKTNTENKSEEKETWENWHQTNCPSVI